MTDNSRGGDAAEKFYDIIGISRPEDCCKCGAFERRLAWVRISRHEHEIAWYRDQLREMLGWSEKQIDEGLKNAMD